MHTVFHPSLEVMIEVFLLVQVITFTFHTHARMPPFRFNCLPFVSSFVFLTRASLFSLKHSSSFFFFFFPSPCLFVFRSSVSVVAGNVPELWALSRNLQDVLVNTVGAVIVMYCCNPTTAVRHGCQLPWETRWFIFHSSVYGPIYVMSLLKARSCILMQ